MKWGRHCEFVSDPQNPQPGASQRPQRNCEIRFIELLKFIENSSFSIKFSRFQQLLPHKLDFKTFILGHQIEAAGEMKIAIGALEHWTIKTVLREITF